jgi:hypothetical protein
MAPPKAKILAFEPMHFLLVYQIPPDEKPGFASAQRPAPARHLAHTAPPSQRGGFKPATCGLAPK